MEEEARVGAQAGGSEECRRTFSRAQLGRARQSGAATRQNQKPGQVPLGVRIPPGHVAETRHGIRSFHHALRSGSRWCE
ncbi:hypothetical protein E2C01_027871 [Portunus trituberculatus]|uniref:Uncharacterized protein n=1 Tax=Portunus trituberculatus TaxID=210409 RepID=A0A5B7EJ94_PORTR|nr:hypothetical protein [Portunus trituberculatus]